MQKHSLLFLILISVTLSMYAQTGNVGIGKTNPAEKLDVLGNINVDGTIKVNGVDGTANQVLMKNGEGTLTWGSLTDYKNFKMFEWVGNNVPQNFTIPAGVTKVAVELWGAGGGGSINGGGGAGGYGLGIFNVTPGGTATILVGTAGVGYSGPGSLVNGTESRFTFSTSVLGVNGGSGSVNFPGAGGSISTYSEDIMFLYYPGQTGRKNMEQYQQVSPTEFAIYTRYGNGGVAWQQMPTGGEGGFSVISTTTAFTLREGNGAQGLAPGEGGGGGKSFSYPGAYGRVIVRW
jgi:hypothetical protein